MSKGFQVWDKLNETFVGPPMQSKSEAKRFIETQQLTPGSHEIKDIEVGSAPTAQTADKQAKKDQKTDFDNAQRTTTFDQEVVRLARQFGVNPDNFEDEEDLRKAVETRQAEQAEADQKAEDEKIKPSEEDERSNA